VPTSPKRKAAGVFIALIAIVLVLVLLLTPIVQSALFDLILSPFQKKMPAYVTYEVQRDIVVSANGGSIVSFTLDVPVIQDIESSDRQMQSVLNVSYDPEPTSLSTRYGVDWAVWQHDELSGEQSYRVRTVYEMRVEAVVWDLDSSLSANLTGLPENLRDRYLLDEWKIIVNDPQIQNMADDIVKGETNVYSILFAINAWIVDHIEYPDGDQLADPSSSVETLQSRVGDCDDQAILFCALARASGVPAWLQLGALYDTTEHEWVGHGWVQTYVPLKAGGGEKVVIDTVNRDFMIWKPNRFAEYTDDGNGEHLYDYYYSFNCVYEPSSYLSGEGPEFEEEYVSLSYSESIEKIRIDGFLQLCSEDLADRELALVKRF
jgi:hypothetical protein